MLCPDGLHSLRLLDLGLRPLCIRAKVVQKGSNVVGANSGPLPHLQVALSPLGHLHLLVRSAVVLAPDVVAASKAGAQVTELPLSSVKE